MAKRSFVPAVIQASSCWGTFVQQLSCAANYFTQSHDARQYECRLGRVLFWPRSGVLWPRSTVLWPRSGVLWPRKRRALAAQRRALAAQRRALAAQAAWKKVARRETSGKHV